MGKMFLDFSQKTAIYSTSMQSDLFKTPFLQIPSFLLDVLVHEPLVELIAQTVVDEVCLLGIRLSSGAVLEHNIVIPTLLDLHVSLASVGILLFQKRVS